MPKCLASEGSIRSEAMAPKKKPAGKGAEGEVDLFEEFMKRYAKAKKEYDVSKIPEVEGYIVQIGEEGDEAVPSWNFYQEFDPMAFRILMHSLRQSGYNKMQALRVWKCNGGDESVRSICYYLDMKPEPEVIDLQFTDNEVTPLGCEFIGRTLGPGGNGKITFLRLDYNKFGAPGVERLKWGLSQNSALRVLSLQYCDITGEEGGRHLSHILLFIRSALEQLLLKGNNLGNDGVLEVMTGAKRAKKLKTLDISDNKFSEAPDVIDGMLKLFAYNTTLANYKLSGNEITDVGAQKLIHGMIGQSHLAEVVVPERCSVKTFEALEQALGAGKGKGKKGKKGKKK